MRVGFVVCPPYQGATLLSLLLNNHSLISALAECSFPMRSVGIACACGQFVTECEFWQSVRLRLNPVGSADLSALLPVVPWPLKQWQFEWSRVRFSSSPRLNRAAGRSAAKVADFAAPVAWRLHRPLVEDFAKSYRSLYELVLEEHGTSIFVDGHKSWRKARLLGRELARENDVRFIHVVRDPRGFAYSMRRHGQARGLQESAWMWRDLHRRMVPLSEIAPYHLLRYEDLAVNPEAEMRKVFDFLGVEPEEVVEGPKYPAKHHVVGNDMAGTFDGEVRLDTRWRVELSPTEQQSLLAAAGPFAVQLGYEDVSIARAEPSLA